MLSEGLDRFFDDLLHLVLNDFLAFLLDQVVWVVLAHVRVDAGREPNDRLGPGVADVNANKHVMLVSHSFWELQVVKVPSSFRVDLAEDVCCLWQIKRSAVTGGHNLWWHAEGLHHLFVHLVVALTVEDADDYDWMPYYVFSHHVLLKLELKLFATVLTLQLDEIRLLDFQL